MNFLPSEVVSLLEWEKKWISKIDILIIICFLATSIPDPYISLQKFDDMTITLLYML